MIHQVEKFRQLKRKRATRRSDTSCFQVHNKKCHIFTKEVGINFYFQNVHYNIVESPATKPNKKARVSNSSLEDDIAILLARGFTLRQAYEQLCLHQPHVYLPDENNERHDALTSCDSSCTGTTSITSQSSFSTLTMSLDSANFYPSKPNTAVEYYGNPLRRGEHRPRRRRSSHHQFCAQNEVGR